MWGSQHETVEVVLRVPAEEFSTGFKRTRHVISFAFFVKIVIRTSGGY